MNNINTLVVLYVRVGGSVVVCGGRLSEGVLYLRTI